MSQNSYKDHFNKLKHTSLEGRNHRFPLKKTTVKKNKKSQSFNVDDFSKMSDIDKVRLAMKKAQLKKRNNAILRRQSAVKEIPIKTIILLLVGAAIALTGLFNHAYIDKLISKIEINLFSQTYAKDNAGKKPNPSKEGENPSKLDKKVNKKKGEGQKKTFSDEEISYFTHLNQRKIELDKREKELEKLEEELRKQKKEIDARIQRLQGMRQEISKILKDRVEVDQKKVKKLVEFYSNMKPQQASVLLSKLNEDLAVEILGQMKKKNAADILNLIEPIKAQNLSEKFAGYQFK